MKLIDKGIQAKSEDVCIDLARAPGSLRVYILFVLKQHLTLLNITQRR